MRNQPKTAKASIRKQLRFFKLNKTIPPYLSIQRRRGRWKRLWIDLATLGFFLPSVCLSFLPHFSQRALCLEAASLLTCCVTISDARAVRRYQMLEQCECCLRCHAVMPERSVHGGVHASHQEGTSTVSMLPAFRFYDVLSKLQQGAPRGMNL